MSSEGKTTRVGSLDVIWARTNHPVFAAGYLLTKGQTSILYSGDTTTTEALRSLGHSAEALAAVFIETYFMTDWSLWRKRPVI
jgi:ribonuclease BN (tRNA processing enzyme)